MITRQDHENRKIPGQLKHYKRRLLVSGAIIVTLLTTIFPAYSLIFMVAFGRGLLEGGFIVGALSFFFYRGRD